MLDSRQEILKTLRAIPVVLRALVNGVEDAQLRRRPAPGEWAIIEVVGHLADTEERALGRVRRMLAGENPELAPFDQEALAEERRAIWTWTWTTSWPAWSSCAETTSRCWTCWTGQGGTAPAATGSTAS